MTMPHPVSKNNPMIGPLTVGIILGAAGSGWVVREAITPSIAQAYNRQGSIVLTREPGETYETLIRRAEAAVRAEAQRSFDQDILITEVTITVVGESERQAAPLLTLSVNREQWRSLPDPQRWSTYYRDARSLLGLGNPAVPTGTPTPTATSSPSPATDPATSAPGPTQSPTATPSTPSASETDDESLTTPMGIPDINIPATPEGELALPRSILE